MFNHTTFNRETQGPELARWAFYNIGATMRSHHAAVAHRPDARDARDARTTCPECGQTADPAYVGPDGAGVCAACRDLARAPQGEPMALFTPAPAPMPGQTSF